MRRRLFIQAATVSLLLPATLGSCLAAAAAIRRDYVFFDERFPQARRLATAWPIVDRLTAVQGDITPFWNDGLDRVASAYPLQLRGVTTESFRFCLRTLVSEHAGVDAQVSRLDRDLLVWTMFSTPNYNNGTHHG